MVGLSAALERTARNLSEVLLHYDAGQTPTISEVFLKPLIGSVSAYGEPYSGAVQAEAEDGITSPGCFEAIESSIEADDALSYAFFYRLPNIPSIACSLNYELTGCMVFVHKRPIGGFVELPSAPDTVKESEGVIYNTEKGSVGFSEKLFLSFCRFKDVQNKTLLHVADSKLKIYLAFKWIMVAIPPTTEDRGLPCELL